MEIRPHQVEERLVRKLDSVYYVAGDEILLIEETCNAIIEAAREAGFTELQKLELTNNWNDVLAASEASSLFSDRKVLDVRLAQKTIDRRGLAALREYLDDPPTDTLLLLRASAYEYRHRFSAWFKLLQREALIVIAESIPLDRLPDWIENRCRAAGLHLDHEALSYLADCSEGNLYNAQQEIEKLKLAFLDRSDVVKRSDLAVLDSSKGNTFEMIDQACLGNITRAQKVLTALRREGVAIPGLLGALTAQLRRIHSITLGKSERMSPSRARYANAAARRLRRTGVEDLLVECAVIDTQIKGIAHGDPWSSFENVLLALGGSKSSELDRNLNWLTIDHES